MGIVLLVRLVVMVFCGWVGGLTLVLDLGLEALLVVGRVGDHLDPPVGERHAVFPLQTIKKYFHAQV